MAGMAMQPQVAARNAAFRRAALGADALRSTSSQVSSRSDSDAAQDNAIKCVLLHP